MTEFAHHHEVLMFLICVVLVAFTVWHYERYKDRRALLQDQRFIWQLVLFGGGASMWTPEPMTEMEACTFCAPLGSIAWVDRQHHKIFYRSHSGR